MVTLEYSNKVIYRNVSACLFFSIIKISEFKPDHFCNGATLIWLPWKFMHVKKHRNICPCNNGKTNQ